MHEVKVGSQGLDHARPSARSSAPSAAATACTFAAISTTRCSADMIVLQRDDGELTTVTMDEFTELARA